MRIREHEVDPVIANAALAAMTKRIALINTMHVLYAWHPLHLAKFGAAMDHIGGGRWAIKFVTGYKPSEYRVFGLEPIEHDRATSWPTNSPQSRNDCAARMRH